MSAIDTNELDDTKIIRVGSRKSELALVQTKHVIAQLRLLNPKQKFEIHTMTTVGDRVLNISLPKIGEKSLFTKDLEDALRNGVVDFVVHSLKDLPTTLPDGMAIGAVLEREDPRDALVLAKQNAGKCLRTLPKGSIIGTSSLRRTAQLARKYTHLQVQDIRGNLNTRLAKLDANESKYAGIILAHAGLARLGWHDRINQTLEPDDILYAVGQGALAVECRTNDADILKMLQKLTCHRTQCRILAERSFLKTLGGGCSAPVAVHSILTKRKFSDIDTNVTDDIELDVTGAVWSLDGQSEIQAKTVCHIHLNEEQAVECVPLKKAKLGETSDDKDLSPTHIVDHSNVDGNEASDVVDIIRAHSDSFKKCPYSSILSNAVASSSTTAAANDDQNPMHLKCPLHFAVGEDVMGQCPYIDSSNPQSVNKILAIEDISKEAAAAKICPYAKSSDRPALKCPFITAASVPDPARETTLDEPPKADTLFCGIFPHECWPLDVYRKCEKLGQDLAAHLIDAGALKVMEAAQNEIRSKA